MPCCWPKSLLRNSLLLSGLALLLVLSSGCIEERSSFQYQPYVSSQSVETVDIVIDVGDGVLGAYDFTLLYDASIAHVIGVTAGTSTVFADPPTHSKKSFLTGNIRLLAYQLSEDVPTGRVHVARVSFRGQQEGVLQLQYIVNVLSDPQGQHLPGEIILMPPLLIFYP